MVVGEANAMDLGQLMTALPEAELNINYLDAFIPRPRGKSVIGLSVEDDGPAEQPLRPDQFQILRQADISR